MVSTVGVRSRSGGADRVRLFAPWAGASGAGVGSAAGADSEPFPRRRVRGLIGIPSGAGIGEEMMSSHAAAPADGAAGPGRPDDVDDASGAVGVVRE
jgi:hypothetical protein